MSPKETMTHTMGIIGGGKSGHAMLRFLHKTTVAEVVFVVDPAYDALGMKEARSYNIPAFTKLEDALRMPFPDYIFAISSNAETEEKMKQALMGTPTRIINQATSRMVVELVEDNRRQLQQSLSEAVKAIQNELLTTLNGSQNLVVDISQMMTNMQMLALNASIEAATAGHAGKGFAVVADNMTKSVDSVRKLTVEIDEVNKTLAGVSGDIVDVLELLK